MFGEKVTQTLTIFVKILTPLVLILLPSIADPIFHVLGVLGPGQIVNAVILTNSLHGSLNTLSTLGFVASYRKFTIDLVKRLFGKARVDNIARHNPQILQHQQQLLAYSQTAFSPSAIHDVQ